MAFPTQALVQAPLAVQEVAVQDKADEEVLSDLEDSDEDMDLFGEATEEEKAARQKVIDQAKKRGEEKAKLTKSMIVLDVKPWDDTTGIVQMLNTSHPSFSHPLSLPLTMWVQHVVATCTS